jgi:hypothetical protein
MLMGPVPEGDRLQNGWNRILLVDTGLPGLEGLEGIEGIAALLASPALGTPSLKVLTGAFSTKGSVVFPSWLEGCRGNAGARR